MKVNNKKTFSVLLRSFECNFRGNDNVAKEYISRHEYDRYENRLADIVLICEAFQLGFIIAAYALLEGETLRHALHQMS